MLRLVRKANVQTCRWITTTPAVSYDEAKPYSSVPSPFSLPFIGNGYLLLPFMKHESGVPYSKSAPLLHHDLTRKLGPIYKFNLFGFKLLMLSDPKDIQEVYKKEQEFPCVPQMSNVYGRHKKMCKDLYPTNQGVIGIDGPDWWKTRSEMNRDYGRIGVAESYIPGLEEIAEDFIKLCTDHILDENNDTPDNFTTELYPWAAECTFYILLNHRLGVSNKNLFIVSNQELLWCH